MSDQGKRLMFFSIQLMFSDSQAKKFVGKKWRITLPVATFYADFFSSGKVMDLAFCCQSHWCNWNIIAWPVLCQFIPTDNARS